MKSDDESPVIRIEGIDPTLLHKLLGEFPELKEIAVPEPVETPVSEDRELASLALAIPLATAGVQLLTAVINYVAAAKKKSGDVPTSIHKTEETVAKGPVPDTPKK